MTNTTPSTLPTLPLPREIGVLVDSVSRLTKLRAHERADIKRELTAHFLDGLDTGKSADELIANFGDARTSAKLLRAGAMAKRSPLDRAFRRVRIASGYAFLLFITFYAVSVAFLWMQRPVISFDPIARFHSMLPKVAEHERAWPIYKQGLVLLADRSSWDANGVLKPEGLAFTECVSVRGGTGLDAAVVDDAAWALQSAALTERAAGLELLARAASMPALGYVPHTTTQLEDADVFALDPLLNSRAQTGFPLLEVLLPQLKLLRDAARMLAADSLLAAQNDDGARFTRNITAIIGLAHHAEEDGTLISQLIGNSIRNLATNRILMALEWRPQSLSDEQLTALRILLREIPDTAYQVNLSVELLMMQDLVQRTFSDDGNGDGLFNPVYSIGQLARFSPRVEPISPLPSGESPVGMLLAPVGALISATRKETTEICETLYRDAEHQSTLPLWQQDFEFEEQFEKRVNASTLAQQKWFLPRLFIPAVAKAGLNRRRGEGNSIAAQTAIALEQFRRAHAGAWPTTMDALVPEFLTAVPKDPHTGDAIKYTLVDGLPTLWSVGNDKIDQHGRSGIPTGASGLTGGIDKDKIDRRDREAVDAKNRDNVLTKLEIDRQLREAVDANVADDWTWFAGGLTGDDGLTRWNRSPSN